MRTKPTKKKKKTTKPPDCIFCPLSISATPCPQIIEVQSPRAAHTEELALQRAPKMKSVMVCFFQIEYKDDRHLNKRGIHSLTIGKTQLQ